MGKIQPRQARLKRHSRIRKNLNGSPERPRLCVFRSTGNIYAQVIDDERGHTLAAASSLDPAVKGEGAGKNKTEQAGLVGQALAKTALERGVKQVTFDRGGYKYHGRVKALAEAAREGGLKF